MVNLLGKQKKPMPDQASGQETPPKPTVDISRYQDPAGLSLGKLEVGLWYLKHRLFFLYLLYGLLIVIALATWPWFIWTYGRYIFAGMKEDAAMLRELSGDGHDRLLAAMQARRPKDLEWQNAQALPAGDNDVSFIANVHNPNDSHFARFSYVFNYGNSRSEARESFLYPRESKPITAVGAGLAASGRLPALEIVSVSWKGLDKHAFPDWEDHYHSRYDVLVSDETFVPGPKSLISNKQSISQAAFSVENKSAYSYKSIGFTILLKQGLSVAGVERWSASPFISGEKYAFNLSVIGPYAGVNGLEIIPDLDIIDPANYLYISSGPAEPK